MAIRNKGPKTQRTNGNLGRRIPNRDGVSLLVMNGVSVVGGAQLGQIYKLITTSDLTPLKIDAAYDNANKVLVFHHVSRAFLRNPNIELYIFLVPQKVAANHITPDVMCDKANNYVAKALADARAQKLKVKLLGVAYNPESTYVPVAAAGIDATGALAKAKLHEILSLEEDNYNFINAVLEARSFTGVINDLVAVEAMAANLKAPRIRFVIGADLAISSAKAEYQGYASLGDEIGMMSLSAISENYGNPIEKFNLTNVANNAFIIPGLSGNIALPTDNALLNSIEGKGYIYAEPIEGVDGIYFNDTRTCVPANDDYAYVENNRTIDKVLLTVRTTSIPLTTNARLQVDETTGELTLTQKSLIEDACADSLEPIKKDGDISGGISCIIPSGINVLAGEDIPIDVTFVPVAIGRAITIRAGMNNPFNS